MTFSADSYWRGETHRWCDRPGAIARLLEEAQAAGAEQVIVVSAATADRDPHTLTDLRLDGRGRIGAWLASEGAASVRDAVKAAAPGFRRVLTICPDYNPLGPLDMVGTYDERSDRVQLLAESIDQGYADAYRQFIEPVVGGADPRFRGVLLLVAGGVLAQYCSARFLIVRLIASSEKRPYFSRKACSGITAFAMARWPPALPTSAKSFRTISPALRV